MLTKSTFDFGKPTTTNRKYPSMKYGETGKGSFVTMIVVWWLVGMKGIGY